MTPMLELKNINASYDFLQVLWGVSLNVDKGELVALIGPNGAGKSTTLRTIIGLISPKSGEVLFNGKIINNMPVYQISRMGISYVSEKLNLFTAMSVQENLILGAFAIPDKEKQLATLAYIFELFPPDTQCL